MRIKSVEVSCACGRTFHSYDLFMVECACGATVYLDGSRPNQPCRKGVKILLSLGYSFLDIQKAVGDINFETDDLLIKYVTNYYENSRTNESSKEN